MGESLESPLVGVIEEGTELYPAGSDIGSGQSMQVLARCGLPAVVDGVDLPETGLFSFFACVEGTDGDTAFEGIHRFCEAFPLQPEGLFVFFEVTVYGRGAYLFQHFRDFK